MRRIARVGFGLLITVGFMAATATSAHATALPSSMVLIGAGGGECNVTVLWAPASGSVAFYAVNVVDATTHQPVVDTKTGQVLDGSWTWWVPGTPGMPTLHLPGSGTYQARVITVGTDGSQSAPKYSATYLAFPCAPLVIGSSCSGGVLTTTVGYAVGTFVNQTVDFDAYSANGGAQVDQVYSQVNGVIPISSRGLIALRGLTPGKSYVIHVLAPLQNSWAELTQPSAAFTANC
ncbi:MAG TPA: hypothetical protein VL856_09975 [Acidimicrobiia bacterium]|jgi:hypothetical protein|nr:hypothetical protein [Acidimicrobiia bacterium]